MVYEIPLSLKRMIEEEFIEIMSFCDNFTNDLEKVIDDLDKNEKLDRENDKMRTEVFKHLLAAKSAFNMKNYKEMSKHIEGAMQKLNKQEQLDLRDDKPRTDAKIKLSQYQQKAINEKDNIRKVLELIKDKDKLTDG